MSVMGLDVWFIIVDLWYISILGLKVFVGFAFVWLEFGVVVGAGCLVCSFGVQFFS